MNEYRCTRNTIYGQINPTPAQLEDRQGHYIAAETEADAYRQMQAKYPQDDLGFTVQLWKDANRQRV